jgi:hypothetical protein
MEKITLLGPGPFLLPVAQRATATGHTNNGVTMTVYAQVAKDAQAAAAGQTELVPISIQMVSRIARELAGDLLYAATVGDQPPSR